MLACQQRVDVGALGRAVQESDRLTEFREAVGQPVMQVVGGVGLLHDCHGLLYESPQPLLVQPFGGRIDGGQGGAGGFRLGADDAVLRMNHFKARRSVADVSETTQTCAAHQLLLLNAVEVEEAQRHRAGAVGKPAQQGTAAPVGNLGEFHFALHQDPLPGVQTAQGPDLGSILVTKRQQAEQVRDPLHPEARQSLGDSRADAPKRRDRPCQNGTAGIGAVRQSESRPSQPLPPSAAPPRRWRRGQGRAPGSIAT